MEHRWGERMALELPVRLDARPGMLALGQTRDVSLSGAYVKTIARFPPLSGLYVELEGACRGDAELCRIPAYIVRVDEDGVAVEWREYAPSVIRRLLNEAAPRSASRRIPEPRVPPGPLPSIDPDSDSLCFAASAKPNASPSVLSQGVM
jgi:hypothetical protein